MSAMETRVFSATSGPVRIETRADGSKMLKGYAAVFYRDGQPGTEYCLWSDVYERIAPGCFDRCIAERQDVRGLFNHDPNYLLGRVANNTLRLSADDVGLDFEMPMDESDPDHQKVLRKVQRGDLTGCSFSFVVRKETWDDTDESKQLRIVQDCDVFDVGPVTFPAYGGTSVSARQEAWVSEARRMHQEWRSTMASQTSDKTVTTEQEAAQRALQTQQAKDEQAAAVAEAAAQAQAAQIAADAAAAEAEQKAADLATETASLETLRVEAEQLATREHLAYCQRKLAMSLVD